MISENLGRPRLISDYLCQEPLASLGALLLSLASAGLAPAALLLLGACGGAHLFCTQGRSGRGRAIAAEESRKRRAASHALRFEERAGRPGPEGPGRQHPLALAAGRLREAGRPSQPTGPGRVRDVSRTCLQAGRPTQPEPWTCTEEAEAEAEAEVEAEAEEVSHALLRARAARASLAAERARERRCSRASRRASRASTGSVPAPPHRRSTDDDSTDESGLRADGSFGSSRVSARGGSMGGSVRASGRASLALQAETAAVKLQAVQRSS